MQVRGERVRGEEESECEESVHVMNAVKRMKELLRRSNESYEESESDREKSVRKERIRKESVREKSDREKSDREKSVRKERIRKESVRKERIRKERIRKERIRKLNKSELNHEERLHERRERENREPDANNKKFLGCGTWKKEEGTDRWCQTKKAQRNDYATICRRY
jgi:hypothetical protein